MQHQNVNVNNESNLTSSLKRPAHRHDSSNLCGSAFFQMNHGRARIKFKSRIICVNCTSAGKASTLCCLTWTIHVDASNNAILGEKKKGGEEGTSALPDVKQFLYTANVSRISFVIRNNHPQQSGM